MFSIRLRPGLSSDVSKLRKADLFAVSCRHGILGGADARRELLLSLVVGLVMLSRLPGTLGGALFTVVLVDDRNRSEFFMPRGMLAIRSGMVGQLSTESRNAAGMESAEMVEVLSKRHLISPRTGGVFPLSAEFCCCFMADMNLAMVSVLM